MFSGCHRLTNGVQGLGVGVKTHVILTANEDGVGSVDGSGTGAAAKSTSRTDGGGEETHELGVGDKLVGPLSRDV